MVCLKTLLEANDRFGAQFEPVLFEAEANIGGTFKYRAYENANLVSSTFLTCFSDFRLPEESRTDHVSLPDYVAYLERYVKHFGLAPYMRLATRVASVERAKASRKHLITYRRATSPETEVYECDAVAFCTGLHVLPAIPQIPGIEHIKAQGGTVMHSSEYKTRSQIAGKRVMVLGAGETAMDLVYEAVKADAPEVTMCHRGGFLSFPKVIEDFSGELLTTLL